MDDYESEGSVGSLDASFSSLDSSTLAATYATPAAALAGTSTRRLVAEAPNANIPRVPALTSLCVDALVRAFATHPCLHKLPAKYAEHVLAQLSPTLPLPLTAPIIAHEGYWKRAAAARLGPDVDISKHGGSWKRALFELEIAAAIESTDQGPKMSSSLLRLVTLGAPYVRALSVAQLPSRLNLGALLAGPHAVPRLTQLAVQFGVRDVGMAFDWSVSGATLEDVRHLAGALALNTSLVVLSIPDSMLDDAMTRVLVAGLLDNVSVTSLSLAHNRIGDRGARALAKYIASPTCVLAELNLEDNQIREAGGVALGHALHANTSVLELNLRLNRLSDGCAYICAGLADNPSLTSLNLSANSLDSVQSVIQLRDLVRVNGALTSLDISANNIMSKLGTKLKDGIEHNESLLDVNYKYCQLSREAELAIDHVIQHNLERFREETGHYE